MAMDLAVVGLCQTLAGLLEAKTLVAMSPWVDSLNKVSGAAGWDSTRLILLV